MNDIPINPPKNQERDLHIPRAVHRACRRSQVMLSEHIRVHAFDVRVVHCETLKLLGDMDQRINQNWRFGSDDFPDFKAW